MATAQEHTAGMGPDGHGELLAHTGKGIVWHCCGYASRDLAPAALPVRK